MITRMEAQLGEIDDAIIKTFNKVEQAYLDSEIPLPVRKKMEALMDLRKDFADKVQEMKWALDHSWEELEKGADHMVKGLTQSIKKMTDELN